MKRVESGPVVSLVGTVFAVKYFGVGRCCFLNSSGCVLIGQKLSKRELIIESAIEIFLEEGYVEASVDRIAQHSGVAKQTVYSTFKNKRKLFEAVVAVLTERSAFAQFDDNWLSLPISDFIEKVSEIVLQQIYNRRFPRFLRLITKECRMFPELQSLYGETISKPWLDFVARYLEESDEVQFSDPASVAFCLRACLATFATDSNFDPTGSYYRIHRTLLVSGLTKMITASGDRERSRPATQAGTQAATHAVVASRSSVAHREEVQSIFGSDRRGMILDGALRAFLQSGFTSTSMDDVALASDVSKQTVYGYFTDKKSLFETLSDELLTHLRSELAIPESGIELRGFAQQFLAQLSRPPIKEFIRVVLGESHKFQTCSDKYLLYLFCDYRNQIESVFREEPLEIELDPAFAAMVLIGTLADYSILQLIYSTSDHADLSSDTLVEALFELIGMRQ